MTAQQYTLAENLQASKANNMCTIIIKIFPSLNAIPIKKPEEVHPINEINIHQLINTVCSSETMSKLAHTFASCIPELTTEFFDPLNGA